MSLISPAPVVKDGGAHHLVASVWRPALTEIVEAFATQDYGLSHVPASVASINPAVAEQVRKYVADYGETLVELPLDTWATSVSQWMGTHWDVLVDLWTVESGDSDLVLVARVFEARGEFRIEIDSVHVP